MRETLAEVFRNVLGIDAVTEATSMATVASWDSVRHLNLVLAVEERFGFLFEADEIAGLKSFGDFVAAVERRGTGALAGATAL